MNSERVWLIVNPKSAGGRTGRDLEELEREVAKRFSQATLTTTRGPGDAEVRAKEAVQAGAEVVVAVGGDGTANEVVNGLRDAPASTVMAVLPAGTGSDLVKTLRMPTRMDHALDLVARGGGRAVDVVDLELGAERRPRRCINVAGFGVNGEVVARANRSSKRLGGTATFLWATATALATYVAPTVRIEWEAADGRSDGWSGRLSAAFLALVRRSGPEAA